MNRNRRLAMGIAVVFVVLAAASALTWRSSAAPPGDEPTGQRVRPDKHAPEAAAAPQAPVPGGPGFYMLSALGFRPQDPSYTWDYDYDVELFNPGANNATYAAPVSLPNGATVTKLVAYYYDDEAGLDLDVGLYRCGYDGLCDRMAAVTSSGSASMYRNGVDESIAFPVIKQQSYSYVAWVQIPPGGYEYLSLVNVRIDYSYPVNLPLVTKDH